MTTPFETLQAALADRYPIDRLLGTGGMASVYLAHDRRHDRPVAIKVLHPEMAAAIGAERFAREIRLLARLRHPFILPLYDSGSAAGALFYAMAYVDGESLGTRIGRVGRLPVAEAVEFACQIADALGYAHGETVIHRDVKPENILLSRQGHALLADFGIARKAIGEPASGALVTAVGLAIGTPAYMSPEQVLGEDVDGTSDIYSLAVTLYEMVAGRRPFVATSAAALASMHLGSPVPAFAEIGVSLPPALEGAIRRALAKDPDERFHTAAEFARALREASQGAGMPAPGVTVTSAAAAPTSVVVLPLINVSGDPQSEYLSDGLTDELIGALARVGGLRVISRTSAYAYKGKTVSMREIGAALKVGFAVEGGVRRSGDRLRVTAQLVRVSDDSSVWSEQYERQVADVFEVQDDITQRIVATLTRTLGIAGVATPHPLARPVSPTGYEEYLLGRYHWNKRTKAALEQALELFRRVVARDPGYAPAYSGLADTLGVMVSSWFASRDTYPAAVAAARRAVELDPTLPDAYASLGYLKLHAEWDWVGAEADLRTAIRLNPSFVTARQWLSAYLAAIGDLAEAITLAEQATELDPLSILARINLGTVYFTGGRLEDAENQFRRAVAMEPGFEPGQTWLAICLAFTGKAEEALAGGRRAVALSESGPAALHNLGFIHAVLGQRAEAEALLAEVRTAMEPYPMFVAMLCAALGRDEEALSLLERAVEIRNHWMYSVRAQPIFARYRGHPRFEAVLARLGLPKRL